MAKRTEDDVQSHPGKPYSYKAGGSGRIAENLVFDIPAIISGIWNFYPASGTVPFVVGPSYTTVVPNLNADMVDGLHATDIAGVGGGLTALSLPYAVDADTLGDSYLSHQSGYIRNTGYEQIEAKDGSDRFINAYFASNLSHYIGLAGNTGFMGWNTAQWMDFYTTSASGFAIRFRPGEIADPVIFTITGISWGGGGEIASSDDVPSTAAANTWTANNNHESADDAEFLDEQKDSTVITFTSKYWDGGPSKDQVWSMWAYQSADADGSSWLQIQDPDNNKTWIFKDEGESVFPGSMQWGGGAVIAASAAWAANPVLADLDPGADSTHDLGSTGDVWAEGWFDAIKSDNPITITPTTSLTIATDTWPGSDSSLDFGKTGAVWAQVWVDLLESDGDIAVGTALNIDSNASGRLVIPVGTDQWKA